MLGNKEEQVRVMHHVIKLLFGSDYLKQLSLSPPVWPYAGREAKPSKPVHSTQTARRQWLLFWVVVAYCCLNIQYTLLRIYSSGSHRQPVNLRGGKNRAGDLEAKTERGASLTADTSCCNSLARCLSSSFSDWLWVSSSFSCSTWQGRRASPRRQKKHQPPRSQTEASCP